MGAIGREEEEEEGLLFPTPPEVESGDASSSAKPLKRLPPRLPLSEERGAAPEGEMLLLLLLFPPSPQRRPPAAAAPAAAGTIEYSRGVPGSGCCSPPPTPLVEGEGEGLLFPSCLPTPPPPPPPPPPPLEAKRLLSALSACALTRSISAFSALAAS